MEGLFKLPMKRFPPGHGALFHAPTSFQSFMIWSDPGPSGQTCFSVSPTEFHRRDQRIPISSLLQSSIADDYKNPLYPGDSCLFDLRIFLTC